MKSNISKTLQRTQIRSIQLKRLMNGFLQHIIVFYQVHFKAEVIMEAFGAWMSKFIRVMILRPDYTEIPHRKKLFNMTDNNKGSYPLNNFVDVCGNHHDFIILL